MACVPCHTLEQFVDQTRFTLPLTWSDSHQVLLGCLRSKIQPVFGLQALFVRVFGLPSLFGNTDFSCEPKAWMECIDLFHLGSPACLRPVGQPTGMHIGPKARMVSQTQASIKWLLILHVFRAAVLISGWCIVIAIHPDGGHGRISHECISTLA